MSNSSYAVSARKISRSKVQEGDYKVLLSACHVGEKECNAQEITVRFNQNVELKYPSTMSYKDDNKNEVIYQSTVYNPPKAGSIGVEFIVGSKPGLSIVNVNVSEV